MSNHEEIKAGQVSDVYFERAKQILESKGIDRSVILESQAKRLSHGDWGIFSGLQEVLELLEDMPVDVWALPEGTLFNAQEPVLLVKGNYSDLSTYQTALLGLICQPSGISTKAARCVISADGRPVYSFGARRMHPAIAPMIERAAYIGGCAGVSSGVAADYLNIEPVGTIPHGLIMIMGDSASAMLAFDEVIDKSVPRVAIVDTFGDEKFEALENAELTDSNIYAVRLETPSSRRGDMLQIAKEVRWELDIHGYQNIKIMISGGLDEEGIPTLNSVADEYGVDTPISNAAVIDFSLGIVEMEGEPVAKRGMQSGAKQLYICEKCGSRVVRLFSHSDEKCSQCNEQMLPQLVQVLKDGKIEIELPTSQQIRERVLRQLPKQL
jgi:nicotinate phosphoribosyltransferase